MSDVLEFDATFGPDAGPARHPQVRGYRVTDLSTAAGAVVWLGLVWRVAVGDLDLDSVETFVALAVLVFVPMGLGLAATARQSGDPAPFYRLAVAAQLPAALAVVGSLLVPTRSFPAVLLAVPWLGVTGAIGLFGLWRLRSRGVRHLPELAIDGACLYVPVGAVALLLHRGGIYLEFAPIIVLLTVVHYHYAGFVLPLVTGHVGHRLTDERGRFGRDVAGIAGTAATVVVLVNLGLIAVGITFSPLLELLAVSLFTIAVAALAALVLLRVVPTLPRVPGALLAVAALALFVTMAFAMAYAYSAFPATGTVVGIIEMIRWHGTLNAFGFALPALLALRLLDS